MNISAIISMIISLFIIVGGFIFFLGLTIRKDSRKRYLDED